MLNRYEEMKPSLQGNEILHERFACRMSETNVESSSDDEPLLPEDEADSVSTIPALAKRAFDGHSKLCFDSQHQLIQAYAQLMRVIRPKLEKDLCTSVCFCLSNN